MKTILYFDPSSWPGGSSRSLIILANALDRSKYTPIIATRLPNLFSDMKNCNIISHRLVELNNTEFTVPFRDPRWVTWFLKWLFQIPRDMIEAFSILHKSKPDLIHINGGTAVIFGMAAHLKGHKIIWHIRELVCRNALGRLQGSVYCKCSEKIITISKATKNRIPDSNACVTIYNPAETEDVLPEQISVFMKTHNITPESFRVLLLGNCTPGKGYRFLADTAKHIGLHSQIVFVLAGDYTDTQLSPVKTYLRKIYRALFRTTGFKSEVREKWRPLRNNRQAIFTGYVNSDTALAACNLLVCPNTAPEPLGRTVLEAYTQGIPVITADIEAFNETVKSGQTGYRLPLDPKTWADKIIMLSKNKDLMATLGNNALTESATYNVRDYTKKIQEIYEQTCNTDSDL